MTCNTSCNDSISMATTQSHASPSAVLSFMMTVSRLKHLKRTGWVHRNVNDPETVAGHMYRMAIMSFLIPDDCVLNKTRVMKIAVVHDLAEAIAGDITPHCGVSDEDKFKMEQTALMDMTKDLDKNVAMELMDLWLEYEGQKTAESQMVKDFDKFDMVLQAYEYEKQPHIGQHGLQEFFTGVKGKLTTDLVKSWNQQLDKMRQSSSNTEKKS